MRPGTYLTVLYAIGVLFILFMLLFFKGIRDHGTYLRVRTFPQGAAVAIDGTYAASTPSEILVRKGRHTITVSKPHYVVQTREQGFAGPIFGTLFVRPRTRLDLVLQVQDTSGLVSAALADFAANPEIPEILSQTVEAGYQADAATQQRLYTFLNESKYFVTEPLQLRELLYALTSLSSGSMALTPSSLLTAVERIARTKEKYENFPVWLTAVLPREMAERLVQSGWFKGYQERLRSATTAMYQAASPLPAPSGGAVQLRGLVFRSIPAGVLLMGGSPETALTVQLPHPVPVQAFSMADTEVSAAVYRQFVTENPRWQRSNVEALAGEGLATEGYLEGWQDGAFPAGKGAEPVTGVSLFAAEAFCRWLTAQLPAGLAGYQARLPRESEWEWAARGGLVAQSYPAGPAPRGDIFFEAGITGPKPVGSSPANGYGLRDMAGNVWEWCSDWYSPVQYLFSSWVPGRNGPTAGAATPSAGFEKVVRGGSWTNEKEMVKVYTRASQPPAWCTPYLGFRVVLARVGE